MTLWEFRNFIQSHLDTKIHIYEQVKIGGFDKAILRFGLVVKRKETKTKYDDWTVTCISTTDKGELKVAVKKD